MTITSTHLKGDVPEDKGAEKSESREEQAARAILERIDKGLTMDRYQLRAADTAIYPGAGEGSKDALSYLALKLNGEAGEVAEKYGKVIRDKGGELSDEDRVELGKELSDVLWYIAMLSDELGYSLEQIAVTNLNKLASRKERGVLGGSGDNR